VLHDLSRNQLPDVTGAHDEDTLYVGRPAARDRARDSASARHQQERE
jgi:hypothetical protein